MANVSVYNMEGSEVGKMDLNDNVFAAKVNEHLMHMAVVLQLANKRQGTQKAKTRSEVRAVEESLGDRRERSCKTGFYKSSTVDRRRNRFRSNS